MKRSIFAILVLVVFLVGTYNVSLAADTEDTIKVGVFAPLSGSMGYIGKAYLGAVKLNAKYWNETEGGLFGKKIEVLSYDYQMKPDVAKRLAEKAVLEDKVHVLVETTASHTGKVLMQVAQKYKMIMWNVGAGAASLTGELCNPYCFRSCLNTASYGRVAAAYFKDKPQITKFAVVGQDYTTGHQFCEGVMNAIKEFRPDSEIVLEIYHPLFTKDFAPYITKINESGAQWIFTGNWGPDLGLLVKQGNNLGLKAKIISTWIEDHPILTDCQDAAIGILSAGDMSTWSGLPVQEAYNKYYHANWKEVYTSVPDYYAYPIGSSFNKPYYMRMLFEAAKRVGKWDVKAIIKEVEGMEYEGFNGKVVMRAEDHQLLTPMPVMEIVKENKFFPGEAPGLKMKQLVSIEDTTIPLSLTGCNRKAGEF